jgi:hypothetical protein
MISESVVVVTIGVNPTGVGSTVDEGGNMQAMIGNMFAGLFANSHAFGPISAFEQFTQSAHSYIADTGSGTGTDSGSQASSDEATLRAQVFAGLAGLAISMALNTTQSLNWSVRMASDLESQMVSVERVRAGVLINSVRVLSCVLC